MTRVQIILIAALAFGALYGAVFCYRAPSLPKTVIKTAATALLALWAYFAGGPALLVAALTLSAIGDAFLAGDAERWLLPGMAAFFAAHVAYVPLFWQNDPGARADWQLIAQVLLVFSGVIYIRWLAPVLGKMRGPVFAYAIVILIMGAAAIELPAHLWPVTLGALMFIASDAILANELFRLPGDHRARKITGPLLWALYFGGQALIAWGFIGVIA